MKLPYYDQAVIARTKITRYLLDETHERGKQKAKFFLRFGFTVAKWEVLRTALLQHIVAHEVASTRQTQHCVNYVIDGELLSPDGRHPRVRAVWCIKHGDSIPSFVTAYPLED
jgi:hypothetical protein